MSRKVSFSSGAGCSVLETLGLIFSEETRCQTGTSAALTAKLSIFWWSRRTELGFGVLSSTLGAVWGAGPVAFRTQWILLIFVVFSGKKTVPNWHFGGSHDQTFNFLAD